MVLHSNFKHLIFRDMEKTKNLGLLNPPFCFGSLNPKKFKDLYHKWTTEKNYKLPSVPMAILRADASLEHKKQLKTFLFNQAGIYGWIDLQTSCCYVGSSMRLHIRPW